MSTTEPTIGKADLEDVQVGTVSLWVKMKLLYSKSGSEKLAHILKTMENQGERIAFRDFQREFLSALDGFDFDAMLMYGWAADADFNVHAKDVSTSLLNWINQYKRFNNEERQDLITVANLLEEKKPIKLEQFINALVDDDRPPLPQHCESVGHLIKNRLTEMGKDVKLIKEDFDVPINICGFNIRQTYKVENLTKPLLGLRVVKPFGIKLNNHEKRDRVDMVSVILVDKDRNILGYQGQFQEAWTRVKAVVGVEQKAVMAAIMARNMSHNIGSHVLADFSKQVDDYTPEMVKNFIQYIQERMDFIAGITSGWAGTLESIWFFTELINNFLENEPLIDLLVRSHGYHRDNISIEVNHKYVAKYREKDGVEKFHWYAKNDNRSISPRDFLIAIPGGGCGRHAFFTIIENIVRNSAKYGIRCSSFTLYINIIPSDMNVCIVEIFDNLSQIDFNNDLDIKIQEKLKQDLIVIRGESVEARMENMGLTEMRLAARYLVEPQAHKLCIHKEQMKSKDEELTRIYHIWPQQARIDDKDLLSYRIYLQCPQNLLIVDKNMKDGSIAEGLGIKHAKNVSLLNASNESYLLNVINDEEGLSKVERRFRPSRVVTMPIPNELHTTTSTEAWEAFQTKVYKTWLTKRFNGDSKQYHLFLSLSGSDREATAKKWLIKSFDNELFQFHVLLTEANPAKILKVIYSTCFENHESVVKFLESAPPETILMYDNHRDLEQFMIDHHNRTAVCTLQQSGIDNLKIFNLLCSPPSDEHIKTQLVFSLYEAALTKVLIVDERIAENVLINNSKGENASPLDCLEHLYHDLNVCIPALLWIQDDPDPKFLSNRLKDEFSKNTEGLYGVHISFDGWKVYKSNGFGLRSPECFEEKHIIVMHQGIIDCFLRMYLTSSDWLTPAAYQSTDHFVITSGRGRITRHIDEGVAFLDFSTLKDHMINDFSKYHLVKSLQASKGGIK